ncbi:MAG TPA: hypothetical protein PLO51_01575 [Candidatus Micrarchaeota archaeon]|nr:hypothetical protein [Candidatus Micrarchaeota archaeon]
MLTDIVVVSPLSINPEINLLQAAIIEFIAILASFGIAIAAFQFVEFRAVPKKSVGSGILGAGAGGSALAAFATSCTICQPIWLVWLGFGSASVFLVNYSIYISFASIMLLLYSINSGMRAISKGCEAAKM